MQRARVDLPHPDSPTMARVSPRLTVRSMPLRALTTGACLPVTSSTRLRGLWCKRQDLARYDVGRAAGRVGMGKLMGVEQLFEGRHFDREVIILCYCACAGVFASS